MSTYYYMTCQECKKRYWVGTQRGIFSSTKELNNTHKFLTDHQTHILKYEDEHRDYLYGEDWIEVV